MKCRVSQQVFKQTYLWHEEVGVLGKKFKNRRHACDIISVIYYANPIDTDE